VGAAARPVEEAVVASVVDTLEWRPHLGEAGRREAGKRKACVDARMRSATINLIAWKRGGVRGRCGAGQLNVS